VALGQVFFENFGFPRQSTFHLLLHNHLHYHPRPGVAAVPIASQTRILTQQDGLVNPREQILLCETNKEQNIYLKIRK
jgi:hypothetical protein